MIINWSPSGVPDGDDRVVIPAGKICKVNVNATADTMDVQGTLNIEPSRTLTLENDGSNTVTDPDNSIIDGVVNLLYSGTGSGSTLAFTVLSHHNVSGSGTIDGSNVACKITIAAGTKLVNQLANDEEGIRGRMTIEGLTGGTNGTFRNEGLVEAENGSLVLASTTILEDIEGAVWETNCKSELQFDREALDLNGDFLHEDEPGLFVFNQSIRTCGTFMRDSCGSITLAASKTFKYAQFSSVGSACSNPGTGSGSGDCTSFFTISSDVSGDLCP